MFDRYMPTKSELRVSARANPANGVIQLLNKKTQRALTLAAVYTPFRSMLHMHHWRIAPSNIHASMSIFLSALWLHCSRE